MHLMTFEPDFKLRWPDTERRRQEQLLAADGIHWSPLAYHKRPTMPATLFDVLAGARQAKRLIRRHNIDVVHARSHVPGLMGLMLKRLTGCRLIFDLRGFMAEEYQDAGVWSQDSAAFRLTRRIERAALERADRVVTLTSRAADYLTEQGIDRKRIHVIPCCVDVDRFRDAFVAGEELGGLRDRFTVVYAGSVTGLYLLKEMLGFLRALRSLRPDAHFLVLTAGDPAFVREAADKEGLAGDALTVLSVSPERVPSYMRLARAGVSFRKPTFSQIAASPTKVPEYLAAGIPVVTNSGIGDTDGIVRSERVGVVIDELDGRALEAAARALLEMIDEGCELADRCREVARRYFSLSEVGGPRYRDLYRGLATASRSPQAAAIG
jgi:glycosyltransferase involved in cell wall biosynthesis